MASVLNILWVWEYLRAFVRSSPASTPSDHSRSQNRLGHVPVHDSTPLHLSFPPIAGCGIGNFTGALRIFI